MTAFMAIRSEPGSSESQTAGGGAKSNDLRFSDGLFSVHSGERADIAVDDNFVLVVIGRIDELPAHPFSPPLPLRAEHVLRGWHRSGPGVLEGAAGDFSVVCYDRRSTEVHAFRDIVGAVPLYLVGGLRQVATTDLAAALRASDATSVDWSWVRAYLAGLWPDAERTPYAEIALLPPGSLAVAGDGSWNTRRLDVWRWAEDVPIRLDQSSERFRRLFDDAVRRRLVTAGAGTAVTTSGGLDSSSVLVTARHLDPGQPLTALSFAFTDPLGDERDYQVAAATAAAAELVWIPADEAGGPFGTGPDAVIREHSGPPLVANWFLHSAARRRAMDLGIYRVLDGEDGDGVVGGGPLYLADLLGRGRLLSWAGESVHWSRTTGKPVRATMKRSIREVRRASGEGTVGDLYLPSVRALVDGGYLSTIRAAAHQMWTTVPQGIASPFLDRRVLEYALSLPARHRVHRGRPKVVLRQAMGGRLPDLIRQRRDKANISHAFNSALRGCQRHFLDEGVAMAKRALTHLDDGPAPVLTEQMSDVDLYRAYRYACVAFWLAYIQ